jgi:hypothetical protein
MEEEAKPVTAPLFNEKCISFVKERNAHISSCLFTLFILDHIIKEIVFQTNLFAE